MRTNQLFRERMLRVEEAQTDDFQSLVRAAELEPSMDFVGANLRGIDIRGCDLREFNFRFADLTGAIIDEHTILPELEAFEGARIAFIELDAREPIVDLMRRIEASRPTSRGSLLSALVSDYHSPSHVDEFLLRMAAKEKSGVALAELLPFFSELTVAENRTRVFALIENALTREMARPEPRKKVGARTKWTEIGALMEALQSMQVPVLSALARDYRNGAIAIDEVLKRLRKTT